MRDIPPLPEPPRVIHTSRRRGGRIVLWILGLLIGLFAVAVIGVVALLHSRRFHNYVLIKARQSASESLGVPVELQNYALRFNGVSPTVDLYGVVIHGAAPYANPPLLQAEQARIGVRVVSLLSKKWYLDEITIHHSVVQIRVDANGNNNLPKPQQSSSNSGVQTLFDLAIRHAVLDKGELYYNDRQSALDADVREAMLNARFDPQRNTYAGQIAYTDGHLKTSGYEPIPHAMSAEFEMTPSHLDLRKAELRSGASAIAFTATVDDFTNPRVAAVYHGSLDSTELRRVLRNEQLPLGTLLLDGHAEYAAKVNQPALNTTTLNGTLRSDRLEFHLPNLRTEARSIRATYSLADGGVEIRSLTASLLGGTVDAQAKVRNLTGEQVGEAHAKLNGISLDALNQLANASGTSNGAANGAPNNVTIAGTLQATSDATWKGSLRNLLATADATVEAAAGSKQSNETVPVNGELHASFRNSDQQLTLRKSYLRTPGTTLTLDGTAGRNSQMSLGLDSENLHELETAASIFSRPATPLGLFGTAKFTGTLSGPVTAPRLAGALSGANLRVHGTDWRLLRAHVDLSAGSAVIQDGQLVPSVAAGAPQGNISFSGRAGLKKWSFGQDSPIEVTLNAQRLDAAQVARLAGSTTSITGTLNANLQAHGTLMNPIGQGRAELLRANVAGEPIQSAVAQFNGDGNTAHANLNIAMPSGVTTGALTYYPKQRAYELQAETHNFRLDQLQAVKGKNLSIVGVMNLVANGRGTIDDPQLTASIEIPQLNAQGKVIDHLALQANVAHHVANLSLETRALNANMHGKATVQLTGDYIADGSLDTDPIPLQPLAAAYAPSQAENITGQTELHATMRGPLKQRERIEAHLVIPQLSLHYQKSIDLAASGPILANYANGVLTVERSGLKGTGTDLQFQGSLPLVDRSKPVALVVLGSLDLRLAQLFDPDVTSSGQLRFNIDSSGALKDPNIKGDVQVVNANFSTADAPLALSNGNGTLALSPERLSITSFEGTVGGGKVTARGGVYRPSLQFDVTLSGQGIRLLYPEGVRQGLSANLTLTGTAEQSILRGQVNVDQLSFMSDFDVASLSSLGGGVEEPPSRGFVDNVQLNVNVRSSQNVNLVSRTVSVNGSANLRITGIVGQPVVLGRINLTGGDLLLQGNRYVLQGGVIDFLNPSRTEANVNASLTTTIQQYNIGMRFEGPFDRLRTSYSSDPALPPADIINLIAFGKTQEATNAAATPTNLTAEQSIASAVSGQVTGRVEKLAGISHLSVDPTLGNSTQNAGATVTIQQRVSSKIFVTFSSDVTSTQREIIQLQYQATPRVSVSGTRDQNGGFGFDTRITHEW